MAKKKPLKSKPPSKAYLVSFGDTMTALLAFFIVLNSLAKEQTGAAMYTGTGSFARAFSKSGAAGNNFGNRSRYVMKQRAAKPIYALSDNLELRKGEEKDSHKEIGPDDTDRTDRIIDREMEQLQKFLSQVRQEMGLRQAGVRSNQTVVDSFQEILEENNEFSPHAQELLPEALLTLRGNACVEIILWASMPSPVVMEEQLRFSAQLRDKIDTSFWLTKEQKQRLHIRVKPWLFTDAKRPKYSVVLSGWKKAPELP